MQDDLNSRGQRNVGFAVLVTCLVCMFIAGMLVYRDGQNIANQLSGGPDTNAQVGGALNVTPTATNTPIPAATNTPAPPAPTATPLPTATPRLVVAVTFTCASVSKSSDGTLVINDLCISTSPAQPNSGLNLSAQDCHGAMSTGNYVSLDANGQRSVSGGNFGVTTCAAPFSLTLVANSSPTDPYAMQGTTTVTVQAG